MIKRLIYDVDKTLILGVTYDKQVENTLRKIGHYSKLNKEKFIEAMLNYEDYFNRYTKEDYASHISKNLGVTLDSCFLDIYIEELKTAIPPTINKELINTLRTLSKEYEQVLLTNYFKISQMNRLNCMGLGCFFQECYGESIIKPNKGAFLESIGEYSPEECVMIGDNLNIDILPAQNLGLHTILVNTDQIETNGLNTIVVDKVEDINIELIQTIEKQNTKTLKLH